MAPGFYCLKMDYVRLESLYQYHKKGEKGEGEGKATKKAFTRLLQWEVGVGWAGEVGEVEDRKARSL